MNSVNGCCSGSLTDASKANQKLDYLDNCSWLFYWPHEIIVATDNDEANISKEELNKAFGSRKAITQKSIGRSNLKMQLSGKGDFKDLNEVPGI